MENQNHQSIIIVGKDTQPPAASPIEGSQKPAKGSLAREIGMAIFGQFLTFIVSLFLIFFITTFTYDVDAGKDSSYDEKNYLCNMFVNFVCIHLLLSIPFVAECVRLGGLRTGGHGKRKRCYIGASITSIPMVTGLLLVFFRIFHAMHVPYAYLILFLFVGMIVVAVGTIIGYRKENASAPKISDGTALLPTSRGNPLAQFGMAILGGILALDLGLVGLVIKDKGLNNLIAYHIQSSFKHSFFEWIALSLLLAIPCVAEGVRLAGKLTGGHGKRMRCYIGTAIVPVLVWSFVGLDSVMQIGIFFVFAAIALMMSPFLIPIFAIKGYRKDAESH